MDRCTCDADRDGADAAAFPVEPFRIKAIEPLRTTTVKDRERLLEEAGWNLFRVPAEAVTVDLLTDSGTSAMSDRQWGALLQGDESYAGAKSFFRWESTLRSLFGFRHFVPVHQGRAAEHVLFSTLVRPGHVVPNNTHFDTTRAHVEHAGGEPRDLPVAGAWDPSDGAPFKGNVDVAALERLLDDMPGRVPLVLLTITNNSCGGQPVSLENVRAVSRVARSRGVPFFIDACRFAENLFFVREREPAERGRPIRDLAAELFSLADGCLMSAKKDGLSHIGGFLACNDSAVFEGIRAAAVLFEGYVTYGGLAGRDLDAMALGFAETLDEDYLAYRVGQVRALGERLARAGVPVFQPFGGHAIYVDAGAFLPHVPREQFPGQALAIELYRAGGIRSCEAGSVMRGRGRETKVAAPLDLLRLAVPRRVYTGSHLAFVAETLAEIHRRRESIGGVEIVEAPEVLRHFFATFRPLSPLSAAV